MPARNSEGIGGASPRRPFFSRSFATGSRRSSPAPVSAANTGAVCRPFVERELRAYLDCGILAEATRDLAVNWSIHGSPKTCLAAS